MKTFMLGFGHHSVSFSVLRPCSLIIVCVSCVLYDSDPQTGAPVDDGGRGGGGKGEEEEGEELEQHG